MPAATFDAKKERLSLREILLLFSVASVAVLIRLVGITQPYIDAWSYKQGTIAIIAENFYRNGFNIFYPQINWAGSAPGYIGTEFPLVPFIASLLYVPFGVHEWVGRFVSLFFFKDHNLIGYDLVTTPGRRHNLLTSEESNFSMSLLIKYANNTIKR